MAEGGLLARVVRVRPEERRRLLLSFGYNFLLFSSYYILQPLRDEMGIRGGTRNLPWLFMASLVAMVLANGLFSFATARLPRQRFLPLVYRVSLVCLLGFWALLSFGPEPWVPWAARAFFLFVGVFNLFIVSVFWGFMADLWSSEQGKRLFGFLGAGGTLGQLVGSTVTAGLARAVGPVNLLVASVLLLEGAVRFLLALVPELPEDPPEELPASGAKKDADAGGREEEAPRRPSALDGVRMILASPYLLGICLYLFLYTFTSTFLWFEKIEIVNAAYETSGARTAFFGRMNLVIASVTVVVQLFLTGRILPWIGVAAGLALVPGITAAGFVALAGAPVLGVYVVFDVVRKSANYSIARPARELLYTVVGREEKYASKAVIDTFVYRGGDGVAAAAFAALQSMALGLTGIAYAAVPFALVWLGVGVALGREQRARSAA